jgi:hypothetical protein
MAVLAAIRGSAVVCGLATNLYPSFDDSRVKAVLML